MSNLRKDMKELRHDFNRSQLSLDEFPSNPIDKVKEWLKDAIQNKEKDANAFTLSTVSNGQPDARILLLRDIEEDALHFYTNYSSKKADDLAENPKATISFFWPELERQIRLQVEVSKLDSAVSDEYFASRPRASQIGAWASKQSSCLENRKVLEDRIQDLEKEFEGKEVKRPPFWGGYAARPIKIEFWQGRPSRLHDRICYDKIGEDWKLEILYP